MTLQERYDSEQQTFQSLMEKAKQIRSAGLEVDQDMIRSDARMKQLEELLSPQPAADLPPVPAITLVEPPKKRGRKPKESAA